MTAMAWAAGLFEGEGCFTAQRDRRGYVSPVARLEMTDEETVRRFAAVIGRGKVYGPTPARGLGSKPLWTWRATRASDVWVIANWLRPWLSDRRIRQIAAIQHEYLVVQASLRVRP